MRTLHSNGLSCRVADLLNSLVLIKAAPALADPVTYKPLTLGQLYDWILDQRKVRKDPAFGNQQIAEIKDAYGVDLDNADQRAKYAGNTGLISVKSVPAEGPLPERLVANFIGFTWFSVNLNGVAASIVQVMKPTIYVTPPQPYPDTLVGPPFYIQNDRPPFKVEGWVVIDGKAAAYDAHGSGFPPIIIDPKKTNLSCSSFPL